MRPDAPPEGPATRGSAVRRDPIAAIATAPGKGAVGVVRVSGDAKSVASVFVALTQANTRTEGQKDLRNALPEPRTAETALSPPRTAQTALPPPCSAETPLPPPRTAVLLPFFAADGVQIDRGLAIHFPSPHSYTGEDVLEFQAHGGPVVLSLLLAHCLEAGAAQGLRAARPGEFTERAFLNGKLDLAQAEAVSDLIDASTAQAAKSASRSLHGAFSEQVHTLLRDMIQLRMLVEATLDFPEEEIEHLSRGKASEQLSSLLQRTESLGAMAQQGSLLREGLRLVIAGQPNVGKSSLLNALAGSEVAIVTPIAGTTRDRIEHAISLNGVPVHLVDTAGLRDTSDAVEQIGIARTWGAVRAADVVLHLRDLTRAGDLAYLADDAALAGQWPSGVPVIEAWNKADLHPELVEAEAKKNPSALYFSAAKREGLAELRDAILAAAGHQTAAQEGVFMARSRHVHALASCLAHLRSAQVHLHEGAALDMAAEELRLAQRRLGEITGEFSADDLLGEIFTRFCIGK